MVGIYKITNKINNKVYIGESQNIERRWEEHKEHLKENKHHSYKLQQDYNTYGEENFIYEVVEEISSNIKLSVRQLLCIIFEDKYIKQYNSIEQGYNVEYTLQRILEGKRGVFDEKCINQRYTKMLTDMIKNLHKNNGVYISPEERKKQKNKSTTYCLFQVRNVVLDKIYLNISKRPDKILKETIKKLKLNRQSIDLQRDFNKYGFNNFEFLILETSEDSDYLDNKKREIMSQYQKDKIYNSVL
jgi:group I intron endonuclease